MNTRQITKFGLIGIFVMVVVGISIMTVYAHSQGGRHSLVNASLNDIKEAALLRVRKDAAVLSKTIEVPLVRYVIKDDMASLNLPALDFRGEDPPLALVALKGEFDYHNDRGVRIHTGPNLVKYIVYIFDLKAGSPTLTVTSTDGSGFGVLLNDPSLPEHNIYVPMPTIPPDQKLPYGSTLP